MKLLFDPVMMRPGCVILAAAYGADIEASQRFNSETWLLVPTDDMRVFETTPEQMEIILRRVNGDVLDLRRAEQPGA